MTRPTSSRMPRFFVATIGTTGMPRDSLQGVGIDPDPLFLRHVQHVHRDDDRRAQEEELRQEVEAPLEDGGIHQKDDDIGRFMDDEVAGDPLLLRECRQAVGAGEIDDAEFVSFRRVGALLLLDGLSRPVADVLRKPRQDVENRRFSRIGLAGEGDEKRFGLRRFPLPFAGGGEPGDEDLRRLAVSEGDPRFGDLDDDQSAPRIEETDLRVEGDTHPRQPADQGMAAGDIADNPLLAVGEGGDRQV